MAVLHIVLQFTSFLLIAAIFFTKGQTYEVHLSRRGVSVGEAIF